MQQWSLHREYRIELGSSFQSADETFHTLRCNFCPFFFFVLWRFLWPFDFDAFLSCNKLSCLANFPDESKPQSVDESKPGLLETQANGKVSLTLHQKSGEATSVFEGTSKVAKKVPFFFFFPLCDIFLGVCLDLRQSPQCVCA